MSVQEVVMQRVQLAMRLLQQSSERFERSFRHIVHEIRNPLHGISAGVEACMSGELTPAEVQTELAAVVDGVKMMTAVTNDFLDLQKMRTGRFAVKEGAASPLEMVEACVRSVQAAVPTPIEVTVEADVPPHVHVPRGTPQRVRNGG